MFKQYTLNPQPITYYKKETWAFSQNQSGNDSSGRPTSATGSYDSVITVDIDTGIWTYSGNSKGEYHSIDDSGTHVTLNLQSDQQLDGSWKGTKIVTLEDSDGTTMLAPVSIDTPAMAGGAGNSTAVQTVRTYTGDGYTGTKTLSGVYTGKDNANDTKKGMSPYSEWGAGALGNVLASISANGGSCSLKNGKYKWVLKNSFPAPYPTFSWYEVYMPADTKAKWTVTNQEWQNVGLLTESPEFTLDATQFPDGTNPQNIEGQWFLAQISVSEGSRYPLCNWRNVIGAGEQVNLILNGIPRGYVPSWSVSEGSGGTGTLAPAGMSASFRAGILKGDVTITATIKDQTDPSIVLASFSTVLTIKVPEKVLLEKDHDDRFFAKGEAGAGMYLGVTIQPTDVSFGNLVFSEGQCYADPSGPIHDPAGAFVSKFDAEARAWRAVWDNNQLTSFDHARVGPVLPSPPPYLLYLHPDSPPSYTWHIPWYFKVLDTEGSGTQITIVDQKLSVDENTGHAEVIKSKGIVTRNPNE